MAGKEDFEVDNSEDIEEILLVCDHNAIDSSLPQSQERYTQLENISMSDYVHEPFGESLQTESSFKNSEKFEFLNNDGDLENKDVSICTDINDQSINDEIIEGEQLLKMEEGLKKIFGESIQTESYFKNSENFEFLSNDGDLENKDVSIGTAIKDQSINDEITGEQLLKMEEGMKKIIIKDKEIKDIQVGDFKLPMMVTIEHNAHKGIPFVRTGGSNRPIPFNKNTVAAGGVRTAALPFSRVKENSRTLPSSIQVSSNRSVLQNKDTISKIRKLPPALFGNKENVPNFSADSKNVFSRLTATTSVNKYRPLTSSLTGNRKKVLEPLGDKKHIQVIPHTSYINRVDANLRPRPMTVPRSPVLRTSQRAAARNKIDNAKMENKEVPAADSRRRQVTKK